MELSIGTDFLPFSYVLLSSLSVRAPFPEDLNVFSRMSQRLGAGLFCPESQSSLTYEPVLLGQGHHALFFLLDGFFPDDFGPRQFSL